MEPIFLSKHCKIKLQVGDIIKEQNRFTKEYVLFQITKINEDHCDLLIVGTSGWGKVGRTVHGQVSCFFGGQNTAYLCYYMPAGKVLFGSPTVT